MSVPLPPYAGRVSISLDFYQLPNTDQMYKVNGAINPIQSGLIGLGAFFLPMATQDTPYKYLFMLTDSWETSYSNAYFNTMLYYDHRQNSTSTAASPTSLEHKGGSIVQDRNLNFVDAASVLHRISNTGLNLISGVGQSSFTATYGIIVGSGNNGYQIVASGSGRLITKPGDTFLNPHGNPGFQYIPSISTNLSKTSYLISQSGLLARYNSYYYDYRAAAPAVGFIFDRNSFSISGVARINSAISAEMNSNLNLNLTYYNPSGFLNTSI